jgi:hypothetical protein
MKNVLFPDPRSSSNKITQQMMQPLEPRRLMSVTAGFDIAPIRPPVEGAIHAEGVVDSALRQFAELAGGSFAQPTPDFGSPFAGGFGAGQTGGQFGDQSAEFQIAHAIAAGTQIVIVPPRVGDQAPAITDASNKPATISDLYSTIGTSTVSEIDNATPAVSTPIQHSKPSPITTVDDIVAGSESADQTTRTTQPEQDGAAAAVTAGNPAGTRDTGLNDTGPNDTGLNDTGLNDTGLLLGSIAAPPSSETPPPVDLRLVHVDSRSTPPAACQTSEAMLSRNALQSLENELRSVRLHSREIAQTLGRERAITLAHMQLADDSQPAADSISGWKSYAAAVGAAIATIVYAHHEIVREKVESVESGRLFSSKPISQTDAE